VPDAESAEGDTAGIWSMATDSTRQRSGIGRRLLSTALAEAQRQGARRFFLGATPAGYRLYESMGFATRVVTKVWPRVKPIGPRVRR
jgi:ribosomal protein S18 acetylase RimI-like enzyme